MPNNKKNKNNRKHSKSHQIIQNVLKSQNDTKSHKLLLNHSKFHQTARNLRQPRKIINNHPFPYRINSWLPTLMFQRTKPTSFFFLICPRCARTPDSPPAANTPQIQAGPAAPTFMSRGAPSLAGARHAQAISPRLRDLRCG